jgi:hypothetical protein
MNVKDEPILHGCSRMSRNGVRRQVNDELCCTECRIAAASGEIGAFILRVYNIAKGSWFGDGGKLV